METENRVALLALIVRDGASVAELNELLHQYGNCIIGRMGIPYRERNVNIISVAMDALSGKLGRLPGVTAKIVYAPQEAL